MVFLLIIYMRVLYSRRNASRLRRAVNQPAINRNKGKLPISYNDRNGIRCLIKKDPVSDQFCCRVELRMIAFIQFAVLPADHMDHLILSCLFVISSSDLQDAQEVADNHSFLKIASSFLNHFSSFFVTFPDPAARPRILNHFYFSFWNILSFLTIFVNLPDSADCQRIPLPAVLFLRCKNANVK